MIAVALPMAWSVPAASSPETAAASTPDACNEPQDSAASALMLDATVDRILRQLYETYRGMPGFLDVYYHPDQAVKFRPLFVQSVPAQALLQTVPVEVAFDVAPEQPVPQDPGSLPSTSDVLCTGLRPGSRYNGGCTLNFVYTDGTNTFMGTAGHCIGVGTSVFVPTVGTVGTVVFSTGNAGLGNDFALVQLNAFGAGIVNPEMCNWGGPTGGFAGVNILGQTVVQTGHGSVVGLPNFVHIPPRPRAGVGVSIGATSYMWAGATVPGDSGSPVELQSGLALGTHTHRPLIAPGVAGGTRWDHGLALAAAGGFPGLSLVTVGWVHPS